MRGRCLNQTYTCSVVQFKMMAWNYQAVVLSSFSLHPDSGSAVSDAIMHPFHPAARVAVSDPSRAGMTVKVQHISMGEPGAVGSSPRRSPRGG